MPHTLTCALLEVSESWFDKWVGSASGPGAVTGLHTTGERRGETMDSAVRVAFTKARGLHGSPRLLHDLREDGWRVSEKTWRTGCAARGWWHAGSGVAAD